MCEPGKNPLVDGVLHAEKYQQAVPRKWARLAGGVRVGVHVAVAILLAGLLGAELPATGAASVGETEPVSAHRRELIRRWHDLGFGMFIHWTPASELKGRWQGQEREKDLWGEWIMARARIPIPEYEQAIRSFHPDGFDAKAWVSLAREAGMKYLIITAKPHDGCAGRGRR